MGMVGPCTRRLLRVTRAMWPLLWRHIPATVWSSTWDHSGIISFLMSKVSYKTTYNSDDLLGLWLQNLFRSSTIWIRSSVEADILIKNTMYVCSRVQLYVYLSLFIRCLVFTTQAFFTLIQGHHLSSISWKKKPYHSLKGPVTLLSCPLYWERPWAATIASH